LSQWPGRAPAPQRVGEHAHQRGGGVRILAAVGGRHHGCLESG
jgi:hypothetical protein